MVLVSSGSHLRLGFSMRFLGHHRRVGYLGSKGRIYVGGLGRLGYMGCVGYVVVGYMRNVAGEVGRWRDVGVVLMRGSLGGHRAFEGRAC